MGRAGPLLQSLAPVIHLKRVLTNSKNSPHESAAASFFPGDGRILFAPAGCFRPLPSGEKSLCYNRGFSPSSQAPRGNGLIENASKRLCLSSLAGGHGCPPWLRRRPSQIKHTSTHRTEETRITLQPNVWHGEPPECRERYLY